MEEPTEPSPEEQQPVEDAEGVEEDEDEEEVQEEQNSGTESETQVNVKQFEFIVSSLNKH